MSKSCPRGYYAIAPEGDRGFEVDATRVRFGRGLLAETGTAARALGMTRVALFSDATVAKLPFTQRVRDSLSCAGVAFEEYNDISIEPTELSFQRAIEYAKDGRFDGYISVGGGSTMDTAKAVNLYTTYPTADFADYVNAPIGGGKAIPGALKPHIACPTTSGTGSECTGIVVFDFVERKLKTGIAGRALKPSLGIIDAEAASTLPPEVVACTGLDVLSHALESYTALPYSRRKHVPGQPRPLSQGANPFSDLSCLEALRIVGAYLLRAVHDKNDAEAREQMMFAATLAGIGFGNAGTHLPHGMAYAVAGLAEHYHAPGYPDGAPLVPHGMAVIINTPAVCRFTAAGCPERHLIAAGALGADVCSAGTDDAGEVLAARITELMRATNMPNGLAGLGYTSSDLEALTNGAFPQKRLLANAPLPVSRNDVLRLFADALSYW
jgi:hydroxyacid-oxoacid transhydrogenase